MKIKTTKMMIAGGLMALCINTTVIAEVKGWSAIVAGDTTFTVPSGKTFVLQQVLVSTSMIGSQLPSPPHTLFIENTEVASPWFPISITNQHKIFNPPLYFQEGMQFQADTYIASNRCFLLVGLLADSTDLFVAEAEAEKQLYESEFQNALVNNGNAELTLELATPQQAIIKLFESQDLKNWSPSTNSVVTRLASARQYSIRAPLNSSAQTFFRAEAEPR